MLLSNFATNFINLQLSKKHIIDLQNEVSEKETEIDYFKDYLENFFLAGMYDSFILERVLDYEFQIFVSKDKHHYFDDDSKVYNCLIYEKKDFILWPCLFKRRKILCKYCSSAKSKRICCKNGYRITICEEIMH